METYCWLALPVVGGPAAARSLWVQDEGSDLSGLASQFSDESASEVCTVCHPPEDSWQFFQNGWELAFYDIFPKQLGIFSPNFTRLLNVHMHARVQIFI